MTLLDSLASRELLVVTGKGGVGKSSVAAALGRSLAAYGRRVLMLECDPRESLYHLLGVPPSGGGYVAVDTGLYVQNLRPREVVDRLVRDRLKLSVLADRVIASPVYRHFVDGAPGLQESALLGHAMEVVLGRAGGDAPEVDTVVLDAPATGHGVSMLAAPLRVSEVIEDGPVGRLIREVAEFLRDPQRAATVAVTLAEEMPVQETVELLASMRRNLGRSAELIVVNGLYPPFPAASGKAAVDPSLELWRDRRAAQERELARLSEAWSGPRIDLPLVPAHAVTERVETLRTLLTSGSSGVEAVP